jgi:uncharacterized protein YkwD
MRARTLVCLAALAAHLSLSAPTPARAGGYEDAVLDEINSARANPQAYARKLRRMQVQDASYGDSYGYGGGMAQEDPYAVADAIDFLMRQRPLPPLQTDPRLDRAADAHVARQARSGGEGHGAPGGLGQRFQAQGLFAGMEAESISYGQDRPADVVRQLVIDSRVPSRGHRRDMFSAAWSAAGVGCGPHPRWGAMCVIDYAGAIQR